MWYFNLGFSKRCFEWVIFWVFNLGNSGLTYFKYRYLKIEKLFLILNKIFINEISGFKSILRKWL